MSINDNSEHRQTRKGKTEHNDNKTDQHRTEPLQYVYMAELFNFNHIGYAMSNTLQNVFFVSWKK